MDGVGCHAIVAACHMYGFGCDSNMFGGHMHGIGSIATC